MSSRLECRKYRPGQFNPVIQKKIGEHLRRCYEMVARPDYPLPSLLRALMDELKEKHG